MDELLQILIRQFRSQLPAEHLRALELLARAFEHMTRAGERSNRYRGELINASAMLIEEILDLPGIDRATAEQLAANIRRAGQQEQHAVLLELAERAVAGAPEARGLRVHIRQAEGFTFIVMRERGGDLPTGRIAVLDSQGQMRTFENFVIGERESMNRAVSSIRGRLRISARIIRGVLGGAFLLFFAADIFMNFRKVKDPHTSLALMDKYASLIATRDPSNPVVEIQELLGAMYEQTEKLGPGAAGFLYFIRAYVMNQLEEQGSLEQIPLAVRSALARKIREYVQRMRRELAGGESGTATHPPPPTQVQEPPVSVPVAPQTSPPPPQRSAADIRREIDRFRGAMEEARRMLDPVERHLRWLRAVERRHADPYWERAITDQEAEEVRLNKLIAKWQRRIEELGGGRILGDQPRRTEPDFLDREIETTLRRITEVADRLRRFREQLPSAGELEGKSLRESIQRLEAELEELRRYARDLGVEQPLEPPSAPPLPPWPLGHDWTGQRRLYVNPDTGEQRWLYKLLPGWEPMYGDGLEPRFRWDWRKRRDGSGWEQGWIPTPRLSPPPPPWPLGHDWIHPRKLYVNPRSGEQRWSSSPIGDEWEPLYDDELRPRFRWGRRADGSEGWISLIGLSAPGWKFYISLYADALGDAQRRGVDIAPLAHRYGVNWTEPRDVWLALPEAHGPELAARMRAVLQLADAARAGIRGVISSGSLWRIKGELIS